MYGTNRLRLYGLAVQCPLKEKCDCPISSIRKIGDFDCQVEIIDKLTDDQVLEYISNHETCSRTAYDKRRELIKQRDFHKSREIETSPRKLVFTKV